MPEPALTFEASVRRLEETVRQLQKGTVPLSEALALFQEGAGLIAGATKLLDEAELQVKQFNAAQTGEEADEQPF